MNLWNTDNHFTCMINYSGDINDVSDTEGNSLLSRMYTDTCVIFEEVATIHFFKH